MQNPNTQTLANLYSSISNMHAELRLAIELHSIFTNGEMLNMKVAANALRDVEKSLNARLLTAQRLDRENPKP